MICPKCHRRMIVTTAIRSRLSHGDTEHTCRYCGHIITITQEDLRKSDMSYRERRKERRVCTICGINPIKEGYASCPECREKNRERMALAREAAAQKPAKKKQGETLDDIARKARSHGLSYGKYLEARARGEYLSEVDE